MIKFESDDEFHFIWDPLENKFFVAMDCTVSGKDMVLKAEADREWLANMARLFISVYAHRM